MRNKNLIQSQLHLPEHFVDSLRVLFDILDTSRTGFISNEQIEAKWLDLPIGHLPTNLLECLRRVTPHSGMLTFERFLAGVRLSLREMRRPSTTTSASSARIPRVRSEGRLDELNFGNSRRVNNHRSSGCLSTTLTNQKPVMGLNGRSCGVVEPIVRNQKRSQSLAPPIVSKISPTSTTSSSGCGGTGSGRSSGKDDTASDVLITMRSKKNRRAPLPPGIVAPEKSIPRMESAIIPLTEVALASQQHNPTLGPCARNFRPLSTNSIGSFCSSGMTDLRWRHSRMSISPPDYSTLLIPQNRTSDGVGGTPNGFAKGYADEHKPQVTKHEELLAEERKIVEKGLTTSRQMLDWYAERLESLEKRKRMLNKGMVALDSAVHEQKLNFYRAQITELNRRQRALIASNEHGFPNHANMTQLRAQVLPPSSTTTASRCRSSNRNFDVIVAAAGDSCTSASSTASSTTSSVENNKPRDSTNYSRRVLLADTESVATPTQQFQLRTNATSQNGKMRHNYQQKLIEELENKSKLIEQLQLENRLHKANPYLQNVTQQQQQQSYRIVPTSVLKPKSNILNNNYQIRIPSKIPDTLL